MQICVNGEASGMKMFRIKWANLFLFFICFNLFGNQKNTSAYILEVKKASKLYDVPSAKGVVVGEADVGTFLIFLEESKKGLWIKVQDSDGLSGWLPKDRTDYEDIERSVLDSQNSESVKGNSRESLKQNSNDREKTYFESPSNYRISPFFRIYSKAIMGRYEAGIRFDLKMPSADLSTKSSKVNLLSFDAGIPFNSKESSYGYSGAIRFGMKKFFLQNFFYLFDYGYSVLSSNSQLHHHLSLGLSTGVDVYPFDIKTRLGFNIFSGSNATLEVQIGCRF
jgi:hypothetical protein